MTERQSKHAGVAHYLIDHQLDAVLLSRRCNFSWYTCGARNYVATACDVGNSYLLVTRERATVLTNNIEGERLAGEEMAGSDIEVLTWPYYDDGAQPGAMAKAIGSMRVAVDAPVGGVQGPVLGREFDRLRWALTDAEIDRYRRTCTDTVNVVESVARAAKPGLTEDQLLGMLSAGLLSLGLQPWVAFAAADDRIAKYRHPLPAGRRIKKYFMLVTCAERGGLICACTRLAAFGKLPLELADRHRAVCRVEAALMGATTPGMTLGDIYAEAQAAYEALGFADEWKKHHQGGSTGYLPREVKAAAGEQTLTLANQAFAWNPSIAGTKAEDTILCRDGNPALLAAPTNWPMIGAEWRGRNVPRPAILEL